MDSVEEFVEDVLQHAGDQSVYDPVKAHQYYMRTRQLKGRDPASQQLDKMGRPRSDPHFGEDPPPGWKPPATPPAPAPHPAESARQIVDTAKRIETKLGRLRRLMKTRMQAPPPPAPEPPVAKKAAAKKTAHKPHKHAAKKTTHPHHVRKPVEKKAAPKPEPRKTAVGPKPVAKKAVPKPVAKKAAPKPAAKKVTPKTVVKKVVRGVRGGILFE